MAKPREERENLQLYLCVGCLLAAPLGFDEVKGLL